MRTELRQALERVARRFRQVRLWGALALAWLTWATIAVILSYLMPLAPVAAIPVKWLLGAFAVATGSSALIGLVWALRSARDRRWVARRIEANHPELGTGLLAAVEEDASLPSGRLGFLQATVIRTALEHGRYNNWENVVPTWSLRGTQLAHGAALVFLIVACFGLSGQARSHFADGASMGPRRAALDVQVDPGNTELERGSSLLVIARFNGTVPAQSTLVVDNAARVGGKRSMTRSLEDPAFAGRIESVDADLFYRVEFDGSSTETYRVRVFEFPELDRIDAKLVFPRYTTLEPKTAIDIRYVTAVEGTDLTLLCRLNKDVATAKLVDQEGKEIALDRDESGSHVYRASWKLAESRRYRVALVDREGRSNKLTAEIVTNVTKNRPPAVRMAQPAHDVRVSPLEELTLKADLEDDFGLVRHGLSYSVPGQQPKEVLLPGPASTNRRVRAEHQIDFESLHAAPDQLVTYYFWAEDVGPDERTRRTAGDMYFAEVRHFEEIFRQGEQPAGGSTENEGQGGNALESGRLAELQKEIINGTWKLMRREIDAKPSAKFAADSRLLKESQHAAIEQAAALARRLQDATSKANLDQASGLMKNAERHLTDAADNSSISSLAPALASEQAAYQALLKLRAREFQVIRNNGRQRGQSGRSGANGPSQRQLEQLELSPDTNRYEQQRSARSQNAQRDQGERELRQILNRLRELAQRQNDLNERLKQLQSALEEAKTQQARAEIERQLKRLREQEQQILRDADDLRERMEREENRDGMADARQQIEQSREHVRQASQALEEGRLPQAVTEGARAGRQLDNLREQLRKRSSSRFSEEMSEMREQARRLDQDQTRLSEQIEAWKHQPQHSLRDDGQRQQARTGLEEQEKRLEQLLERMRGTVQEAEETEPLLARGLYDTIRKAAEHKIPDALKVAEQLVDLGVAEDAAKSSRRAGAGIQQLREGVERAAKNVLGDETEALRRAQAEIEDLADQVNREIARSEPRAPNGPEPSNRSGASPGSSQQARDGQGDPSRTRDQGRNAEKTGKTGTGKRQDEPAQKGQRGNPRGRQDAQGHQGLRGQGGEAGQQGDDATQGSPEGAGGPNTPRERDGQVDNQPATKGGPSANPRDGRQAGTPGGGNAGRRGGLDRVLEGLASGPGGPVTGEGFRQWSDRMRDVEELLDDPEWRAEAARIRDRVRGARDEFKRHAKEPDWTKLRTLVAEPMNELRERIAEELRRRESPDSLVPIDRDPVPPQFAEGVRLYFERLGSGR
jgi:hypothetical protein